MGTRSILAKSVRVSHIVSKRHSCLGKCLKFVVSPSVPKDAIVELSGTSLLGGVGTTMIETVQVSCRARVEPPTGAILLSTVGTSVLIVILIKFLNVF